MLRTDSEGSGCSRRRPRSLQQSRPGGQSRASASGVKGSGRWARPAVTADMGARAQEGPGWHLALDLGSFVRKLFRAPEGLSPPQPSPLHPRTKAPSGKLPSALQKWLGPPLGNSPFVSTCGNSTICMSNGPMQCHPL